MRNDPHFEYERLRDEAPGCPWVVGEESVMPARLRVGWDVTPQISLHFLGGVVLAGEVELENRSGDRLRREDYDPAPYVGVRFVGRL